MTNTMHKMTPNTISFATTALDSQVCSRDALGMDCSSITRSLKAFRTLANGSAILDRQNVSAAIQAIDAELDSMDVHAWTNMSHADRLHDDDVYNDFMLPIIDRHLRNARTELWFSMGADSERHFQLS